MDWLDRRKVGFVAHYSLFSKTPCDRRGRGADATEPIGSSAVWEFWIRPDRYGKILFVPSEGGLRAAPFDRARR